MLCSLLRRGVQVSRASKVGGLRGRAMHVVWMWYPMRGTLPPAPQVPLHMLAYLHGLPAGCTTSTARNTLAGVPTTIAQAISSVAPVWTQMLALATVSASGTRWSSDPPSWAPPHSPYFCSCTRGWGPCAHLPPTPPATPPPGRGPSVPPPPLMHRKLAPAADDQQMTQRSPQSLPGTAAVTRAHPVEWSCQSGPQPRCSCVPPDSQGPCSPLHVTR